MSQELYYTSVQRGLQPGSRGFCTVAHTQGLAAPLMQKLEGLSGYRPIFPPLDERAHLNPVAISHLLVNVMGTNYHVLSRVCPAGLDYSERTNKFAHHVALDPSETPAGGPAWTLQQPGFSETAWQGEPRLLPRGRTPPRGDSRPGVARNWQQLAGDAGWAGVLAEATLADANRPVFVVTDLGVDVLALFTEALALLPLERRWNVTFSTYFATVPAGQPCLWRWVQKGSAEANAAARQPNTLVIDLTSNLGAAQGGPLVECARTGQAPPRLASPEKTPSTQQRPGSRSTLPPPRAEYVPEIDYSSPTRAEAVPTAEILPEAKMGLDPWERKGKPRKTIRDLPQPAPAASWPTFVGAFIGLLIVAVGAYVVYSILSADRVPTPEEILRKVSTTPRLTQATTPKSTEPVTKIPDTVEPVTKVEVPKPMPVEKEPGPMVASLPKPVDKPPPMIRARDTYVKRSFTLPGRSSTEPRKEILKDVGQVVGLQLIGLDEVADKIEKSQKQLKQNFQDSTLTLKVTVEGAGADPSLLATFQMHKDGNLAFNWAYKANNGAEGISASNLVRDCVLEVKNNVGEVTYFSFRPVDTIKAVLFEPPNVTLEEKKYDVSKPLEYVIESKPIALNNPPLRPLTLEYDSNRKPVVKSGGNEIRVQKCAPDSDGFEIVPEIKDRADLAEAATAANYYYQRFFIIGKLASPPALRGLVVLRVEPRIDTMDVLEKNRLSSLQAARNEKEELAKKIRPVNDKKDVEHNQGIAAAIKGVDDRLAMNLAKIDADERKWKQDNLQLSRRIKPVVTFPSGVVWMKVGDLRVDIYRIMADR